MRKIYNIYVLLVAVVAMAFTSCQGDDNNLDTSNRRGATTFTANFDASRSYFGDKVDGAYPSYWSGDERVMLEIIDSEFLSIRPSESIAMDVVDEAGKYASFTATIEQEFNGGSVYAYVPAASWEYGTDLWGISSYSYKLPTTQTPTATSVDPAAHILRAEYIFEGALPTDVDLTFEHVAAYCKLSIPALEGEDVQSVQIDLTSTWGTEYSYTLNVSELDEPTYWFACESDLIMAIGITAVTADKSYTYERTFESGSEVFFSTGHVRPLTVAGELIDPSQPEPTYPNREILYTATAKVEAHSDYPWTFDTFGANVVSHEWDSESGEGVITFDADVTTIGARAFYHCFGLTSVTIPDSVTTIGEWAFGGCDSLLEFNGKFVSEDGRCLIVDGTLNSFAPAGFTSYTIPDSITTIGEAAFVYCDNLTSVTIGDSVTTIGLYAFAYCSNLTSITIPDSVTTIGEGAFCDCDSLTSVTIPDSVTTIGDYAFYECDSLTSVTIGDSVTTIGYAAFYECDSLTSVTIPNSVTTIGDYAFGYCSSLTSITISDSVTTIGEAAFAFCTNLISITIPNSVTTIGYAAFYNCSSLTSLTIPDSVTTTGDSAFAYCYSLTSLTIPDSVTTIGGSAFEYCDSLTSVTIGDSVTTIGNSAFYGCTSLTCVYCEATTPPSLVGGSVFGYNASGRKIYVPAASVEAYKSAEGWSEYADAIVGTDFSTTSIINYTTSDDQIINARLPIISNTYSNGIGTIEFLGSIMPGRAFYNCDSLTSVTIGNSVTTIGEWAFYDCDSLTSITIPDSVTTIGNKAFDSCSSLTSVYCEATTPPSLGGSDVFYSNASGRLIYVPVESLDTYLNAEGWRDYADYIVGYDFETGEITKPSINLGVCGTFTNWGLDGILDIEMEYLEDRNLYVAYGIELTTDDCFKLRSNNDWSGHYNIGASYYGYVAYPNSLTEVINNPNSQDIFVAESGTYDIYIKLDTMELYFMVEGTDPDTISDMENVE